MQAAKRDCNAPPTGGCNGYKKKANRFFVLVIPQNTSLYRTFTHEDLIIMENFKWLMEIFGCVPQLSMS